MTVEKAQAILWNYIEAKKNGTEPPAPDKIAEANQTLRDYAASLK